VVRKLSAAAERLTPKGVLGSLAEGMRDLAEAIGDFGADIRAAASEREAELRAGTGLDAPLPTRDEASLPLRRGVHAAD
jgi:chromosome condensin MukBEF MukE localization factor